jgi:hypothetical protein
MGYYLCHPLLKKHKFFTKNTNYYQQILKVFKKDLVVKIKALTFALPNKILSLSKEKMGGQKKAKRSLKVWK